MSFWFSAEEFQAHVLSNDKDKIVLCIKQGNLRGIEALVNEGQDHGFYFKVLSIAILARQVDMVKFILSILDNEDKKSVLDGRVVLQVMDPPPEEENRPKWINGCTLIHLASKFDFTSLKLLLDQVRDLDSWSLVDDQKNDST